MRRVPFIAAFAVSAALAVPSPAQDAASTLILDDAIRLALGHNRSLKVVSYGRGISRANLLVAQGQFDPSLAFNRSSSGTRSAASLGQVQLDDIRADYYSAALQGQLPVGTLYSVTASTQDVRDMYSGFARNYQTFGGFTVTQPLLKGFGFDANLEAVRVAKADRSISDLAYRQSAIDTVYSVTASTQDVRDMYSGFARNYQTFGGFTVTQPLLKGFGFDANLEAESLEE